MKKGFVIAIDGPVASGKGTIAQKLSQKINAVNFNSGGVYRAYALYLKNLTVPVTDEASVQEHLVAGKVDIRMGEQGSFDIFLDGKKVTPLLTTPEISMAASNFGKMRVFAEFVTGELRRLAKKYVEAGNTIIMEGRQIGTDVFPDADVKIFLTADLEIRAKRRSAQYQEKHIAKPFEEILSETQQRDEQDMNRDFGALPRYPDRLGYAIIDNSNMNEEQTMDAILNVLIDKGIWTNN